MTTNIAIHGATGRMGKRLVALAHEDPALTIVAAVRNSVRMLVMLRVLEILECQLHLVLRSIHVLIA